MANLSIFHFEDQTVRYVGDGIDHEWIAADICDVLGLKNVSDALSRLEPEDKGVVIADTPGGNQKLSTIKESGLYRLMFKSRKEKAKRFSKWVTQEVLPSIRETGRYSLQSQPELEPQEKAIRHLNQVKDLIDRIDNPSEIIKQLFEDRVRDILQAPAQLAAATPEKTEWSIKDRMEYREIRGCENYESQIGKLAAKKYREAHNKDPLKGHRIFNGKQRKCTIYMASDVDLVDAAIDEYLAKKLGQS